MRNREKIINGKVLNNRESKYLGEVKTVVNNNYIRLSVMMTKDNDYYLSISDYPLNKKYSNIDFLKTTPNNIYEVDGNGGYVLLESENDINYYLDKTKRIVTKEYLDKLKNNINEISDELYINKEHTEISNIRNHWSAYEDCIEDCDKNILEFTIEDYLSHCGYIKLKDYINLI